MKFSMILGNFNSQKNAKKEIELYQLQMEALPNQANPPNPGKEETKILKD